MNVVIQITARDDARAWELLQRHSPGVALPDRTYIVSPEAIAALRKSSIQFAEIPGRDHSAFLNGYSPEDEGLYDDKPDA